MDPLDREIGGKHPSRREGGKVGVGLRITGQGRDTRPNRLFKDP